MRGETAELAAFLTDLMPALSEGDTFLHAAPIAHASGWLAVSGVLIIGTIV